MPTMSGNWSYNSYLVQPTKAQSDAVTVPPPSIPTSVDAVKWAKGSFNIDQNSQSKGHLIFVPGFELVVNFSLESNDGQTIFRAKGVGESGPQLKGVVYELLGWVKLDGAENVVEVSGGILAVKGADADANGGLGGQAPGAVGFFKLSH